MHQGKFVFAQLFDYINRYEFDKCVDLYQGNYKVKDFNCWSQFLYMSFGQITHRESCNDIISCLNAYRNSEFDYYCLNHKLSRLKDCTDKMSEL